MSKSSDSAGMIGIDWGTHSSKWNWSWVDGSTDKVVEGPFKILRSEVFLGNDRLFMSEDPPPKDRISVSGIKGKLIKYPDAAFWDGPQKRIRMTLGELVAFSLWTLMGDCYASLRRRTGKQPKDLNIRFSLPNWVDNSEGASGRAGYEQAARVACYIFAHGRERWSKEAHPKREGWREEVRQARQALDISDDSPIDTSSEGFYTLLQRERDAGEEVVFRFVAESSAAGLACLRRGGDAEDGQLLKILVVDVGAGSTDIGYVLRSLPKGKELAKEALCQLPPANTCELAGEDLTRRIAQIYRSRGETITLDEAEAIKIGGKSTTWQGHPAVSDWIRGIGEHVNAYVWGIPDERFLPNPPGLKVVVTGGSGVVPRLREGVVAAAADALQSRGIRSDVVAETTGMGFALRGPGAKDANRLAVALGAASEELPRLSYHERLGRRDASGRPRRMRPGWTGWGR